MVKNLLQCGRLGFDPWVGTIPWGRDKRLPVVFLLFQLSQAGSVFSDNTLS